jgi:Rrf2 family protein
MTSLTAEHALRAVVFLASRPGVCCTVECIAQHTGVPSGSLAKVLKQLSRAGLVGSHRGPRGGFVLLRPPQEITFMEVIAITDGARPAGRTPAASRDALARHLDDTRAQLHARYHATTIAQILCEQEAGDVTAPKG